MEARLAAYDSSFMDGPVRSLTHGGVRKKPMKCSIAYASEFRVFLTVGIDASVRLLSATSSRSAVPVRD
jgi:hypothetical protein